MAACATGDLGDRSGCRPDSQRAVSAGDCGGSRVADYAPDASGFSENGGAGEYRLLSVLTVSERALCWGKGARCWYSESAALAAQRGAKVYGKILAAGVTNDSHHVSSFDPSYRMGRRAVELCLQRSGLTPQAIDAVHVHGTSTVQNDEMEASLIEQVLGRGVPVMASKGATGHLLGASGAVTVGVGLD